jgi:hypothetical protein
MVDALELALVVDVALGEWRQAVRARVILHTPLPDGAVIRGDDTEPQHRLPVRGTGIQIAHGGQRIPLV